MGRPCARLPPPNAPLPVRPRAAAASAQCSACSPCAAISSRACCAAAAPAWQRPHCLTAAQPPLSSPARAHAAPPPLPLQGQRMIRGAEARGPWGCCAAPLHSAGLTLARHATKPPPRRAPTWLPGAVQLPQLPAEGVDLQAPLTQRTRRGQADVSGQLSQQQPAGGGRWRVAAGACAGRQRQQPPQPTGMAGKALRLLQ